MKIAYVVPYVPNLIRTRSYNLIHQLAALGHEVTIFTVGTGKQDQSDAATWHSNIADVHYQEQPAWYSIWNSLKAVPSHRPLQTVYSWNPRLAKQLVNLLNTADTFDVVHVEHLRGSLYGQYVKSKLPRVPVVWDSVDCISYLFKQASAQSTGGFGKFVTRFELGRTRRMEGRLISEFDHVLVTSDTDRTALLELTLPSARAVPISVLSNGVDLGFFHPSSYVQRDSETLIFSGKMSYHANVSMVKFLVAEIMPRVWAKRPNVRLVVVGKDPPADIRKLGNLSRIHVTGTVDDIRPFLWKATAAVVPLVYGAGIQNKILEAMATRTPVVTTTRALPALQVRAGRELLVADDPDDFSHAVLRLITDRHLQSEIASAGLSYVHAYHTWTSITCRLAEIYDQTCRQRATSL